MKIKVSDATPVQLNYLVGVAEGFQWQTDDPDVGVYCDKLVLVALDYARMDDWSLTLYAPAESWSVAGPIIDREKIDTFTEKQTYPESWCASVARHQNGQRLVGWRLHQYGPTPLIAAMRCYVASRLGDEVEIPDELV